MTTAASPDLARRTAAPARSAVPVAGTVLRLCSVYEPSPSALARADAAAWDPIGGMQNHTAQLTRGLAALGLRQTVLTSRLGGARSVEQDGATTVVRTGAPVRRARQLWSVEAAARALQVDDLALVHAHQGEDLAVLPVAELVARRAGVPFVVTLHCSARRTLDRSRRRPLTVLGPAVERRAVLRADAVLVLTASAAEAAVEDGVPADRVHVVPSGYDPELFARPVVDPLPQVPHPRVLFLGRLHPQKRPVDAVLAHARMADDVHLVVVGDGPLRAEVERAAAASPARDRVHVVGLVPHDDVPAHLRSADAFVLPSQYEELGSVLVEAMASDLPVVAYDVGGIPDLVRDGVTGRLVPRGDVDGLAAALTAALADSEASVRRARRLVEREYSWPALATRVAEVYASVLAR